MGYQSVVVTSFLLIALLLTSPSGYADVAVALVVAAAVLVIATNRLDALRLLHRAPNLGPSLQERTLRGSFRRQHRPDVPGRPQPRAPGVLVGAL